MEPGRSELVSRHQHCFNIASEIPITEQMVLQHRETEPRGSELISRYKHFCNIPTEIPITEQMVLQHWELEKALTDELLSSTPDNRWEVFEQAYTRLYSELDWLNQLVGDSGSPTEQYKTWAETIGSPPQKIYEVGSGKGKLISYLAKCGFDCKATEITKERGAKHVTDSLPNLSWHISDGVHLDRFEPTDFYDVVISNQVVEHIHPDDLLTHFQSVCSILNNNGRYILSTPHRHKGPCDLSYVFKYDLARCMHLKEYTYHELVDLLTLAGFKQIYCTIPARITKILSKIGIKKPEQLKKIGFFYLKWMIGLEKIIFWFPIEMRRPLAQGLRKIYLFADNIFLTAQKN